MAIDKPAGLLVHRTSLDSRATQFALQQLRDQLGQPVFPVHRLDRATSGVLLFGLTSDSARILSDEFSERRVKKTYVALVRGYCPPAGTLDRPLRDPVDARSTSRKQGVSREAVTHFRTEACFELPLHDGLHATSRYSLLQLTPATGRRHQIRRHLKHASHPICGDTTHGDHRHNKRLGQHFGLQRMLLVARVLQVAHPVSGKPISITAPLGEEFDRILEEFQPFRRKDAEIS